MRKMKQLCLLMVLLAFAFLPAAAFADEAGIGVQLNGDALQFTDAAPVMEDNRVYVPFRAVFEALNADVAYDQASSTITAEKGDTKVSFVIGNTEITVNDKAVSTDAASFVRDGRTYVPVRFAAQSLGATVGWDSNSKTVVMLDKAALQESFKGQFTLMDKFMTYSEAYSKETVAVKGTMKFDMKMADGSGEDAVMIPVSGDMVIDGINSAEVASMNMAVTLNLDELKAALEKAGEWTAEDETMMAQMKEFDMDVIMNIKTGKMYMKSELFGMADMDGNAWYMMDLNALLTGTGMDLQTLLEGANSGSYEDYMMALLDTMPVNDAAGCAVLMQTIEQYQDENFQKSGNNYVSTIKDETEGVVSTMRMTLNMDGDKVVGYAQEMSVYMGTAPLMTVKAAQNGADVTMDMSMNMEGMMTMNLSGDMTYSATTEKPQSAPAAGETVIDLLQMANEELAKAAA